MTSGSPDASIFSKKRLPQGQLENAIFEYTDLTRQLPILENSGRLLKTFLLQAMGARARHCDYCDSMIPLGEYRCYSCGAHVSQGKLQTGERFILGHNWVLPLLLCFLFPPSLLIITPILFWRWLRLENRGWILPLLCCAVFPPAALLVAPALLWPMSKKRGAS